MLLRVWHRLMTLLTKRVVAMLTILFCVVTLAALWNMSQLSTELVRTQAVQNAALSIESIQKARTLYSSEVVDRLAGQSNIPVTHDYLSYPNGIPLPVTFLLELSRQIRENDPDMSMRLYSDYPFPGRRKEGGARDAFEKKALEVLRQKPHQPYISFEIYRGREVLRYAEADIMLPSCVACHNTHPNSPKKDWAVGDVRGAMEIIQPLDTFKATSRKGLESTFFMLGGLSLVGISGLIVAIRRLRTQSHELTIANEQLEAVMNAVPGSISWINARGMYLGVNHHFAKNWQLPQEDFIGKMVGFLHGSGQFADFTQ
jgi:adenylate cyclase